MKTKTTTMLALLLAAMLLLTACSGGGSAPLGGELNGTWLRDGSSEQRTFTLTLHGSQYTNHRLDNNLVSFDSDTTYGGEGVHLCGTEGFRACETVDVTVDMPEVSYEMPYGWQPGDPMPERPAQPPMYQTQCWYRVEESHSGTFSITENRIEFLRDDGDITVNEFTYTANTLTIGNTRYTRQY